MLKIIKQPFNVEFQNPITHSIVDASRMASRADSGLRLPGSSLIALSKDSFLVVDAALAGLMGRADKRATAGRLIREHRSSGGSFPDGGWMPAFSDGIHARLLRHHAGEPPGHALPGCPSDHSHGVFCSNRIAPTRRATASFGNAENSVRRLISPLRRLIGRFCQDQ